ncbi:hypothetical protein BX666DRAFT_585259 [Dichotomocladium elegans]|nr:hypothetical protein BX666DRAFT_585259 [Dichotomocladium elegans]
MKCNNRSAVLSGAQSKLTVMGSTVISHLLAEKKALTKQSLLDLLNTYFETVHSEDLTMQFDPNTPNLKLYCLSYILALPKISPDFVDECWSSVFKRLFENDSLGDMFLFERDKRWSMVRTITGNVESVFEIFPSWLYKVVFDRGGMFMKHAIDVSIILDAMAHNPRLELHYLMPSGDKSIIDSLRPSFEQLDLEPSSIELVDWVISILGNTSSPRRVENLKIPLFLLQLVTLKENTPSTAVDTFVQLITKLQRPAAATDGSSHLDDGIRYVVLNLVAAAENKWPGIFQTILERIFSKAIAMHIANSKGSVNVEKILANLAMLFEESKYDQTLSRPGFKAFQTYIAHHWRQVLLLFVNHPSMECRALGYRVLRHSKLWDEIVVDQIDPTTIAKLLTDAWFRHMKSRYLYSDKPEEASVLDELENLIIQCYQSLSLAKAILSATLDSILGGALEIFPNVDFNALQRDKMGFLQKIQDMSFGDAVNSGEVRSSLSVIEVGQRRPPQFLVTPEYLREPQDKIYIDNIERTARLFYKHQELPNFPSKNTQAIGFHIFSHLSSKWPSSMTSMEAYDDALPKNIPNDRDIVIGNTFKDYPVLFLILDKCSSVARFPVTDIIRSILVYFIAFWHIPQVIQAPTALKFATQLEETIRLIMLLKEMLPSSLVYIQPFCNR